MKRKMNETKNIEIIKLVSPIKNIDEARKYVEKLQKIKDKKGDRRLFNLNNIYLEKNRKILYKNYYSLYQKILSYLENVGYEVKKVTIRLTSRLAINLGSESVYEVNIALLRNYLIPYIPASAIKGSVVNYLKIANKDYNLADYISNNVLFFDGLPFIESGNENIILVDSISVHYPKYYRSEGKEEPKEGGNKVIIKFPTIKEGTKFEFFIASKNKEDIDKVLEIIKNIGKEYGIGAKTNVGYGRFEVIKE